MDTNKIGGSHECIICHDWYFLRINFRFHPKICYGCHFMTPKSVGFNDVVIATVRRNHYRIYPEFMTKNDTMSTWYHKKTENLSEKYLNSTIRASRSRGKRAGECCPPSLKKMF